MTRDFEQWKAQMQTFNSSHDGHIACYIVRNEQSVSLILQSMLSDDPKTVVLIRAIGGWLKNAFDGGRPLCLLCDHEFQARYEPRVFTVIMPYPLDTTRENHHTIVSAICEECATRYPKNEHMHKAVLDRWKRMYPGAHMVSPS